MILKKIRIFEKIYTHTSRCYYIDILSEVDKNGKDEKGNAKKNDEHDGAG